MANFEDLVMRDTRANQPAAGIAGRWYFVTDEGVIERDNGSTWDTCPITAADIDIAALASTTPASGDLLVLERAGVRLSADVADLPSGGGGGGGRTLIASQTPSGVGVVTFSSIAATYTHLELEYLVRSTKAASEYEAMSVKVNNDGTAANYRRTRGYAYGTGGYAGDAGDDGVIDDIPAATATANSAARGIIRIPFYKETTFYKMLLIDTANRRNSSTAYVISTFAGVEWENAAAINRVDLTLPSGNFVTGSIANLYGVD
jgi:hypothetical protein